MTTLFLAIETSCDETAAAVFTDEPTVLASIVASQTDLHALYGGVVPEVAARAHLQRLLPVIDQALRQANVTLPQLGGIVVLNTPGLVGALLVGVSAAKMLALALDVPLLGANHIEAHIYAARLAAGRNIFPCVGLVVSGGHTSLFDCADALHLTLLGGTLDDAAGKAFDKVASILGLGFPGGPAVEREAALGNPTAYRFPRSFFHEDAWSLVSAASKPQCCTRFTVRAWRGCAAVARAAAGQCGRELSASGGRGVGGEMPAGAAPDGSSAPGGRRRCRGQSGVRAALERMCTAEKAELFIPPLALCTDNAAMAAIAVEKWQRRLFAPPDLDAQPTYGA